jgi:hypothetical protein
MTIQEWGAIGELVGGVAVLATLVYLAVQLRRTTRVAHRQTYNAGAEAISRFSLELAKNPEIHSVYRRALATPEKLSADELLQGHAVVEAFLALNEGYYLHNVEYGETLPQQRWGRILRRILSMPGGKSYWKNNKWKFHAEFVEYMDTLQANIGKGV